MKIVESFWRICDGAGMGPTAVDLVLENRRRSSLGCPAIIGSAKKRGNWCAPRPLKTVRNRAVGVAK